MLFRIFISVSNPFETTLMHCMQYNDKIVATTLISEAITVITWSFLLKVLGCSIKALVVTYCHLSVAFREHCVKVFCFTNTEVKKLIYLAYVRYPWPLPWLVRKFYPQKIHVAQRTLYSRELQFTFAQLTHVYCTLIRWSRINRTRKLKVTHVT